MTTLEKAKLIDLYKFIDLLPEDDRIKITSNTHSVFNDLQSDLISFTEYFRTHLKGILKSNGITVESIYNDLPENSKADKS